MPLTRAQAESVLVARCGLMIDRVRLSLGPTYTIATDPSPRPVLSDPLALSARSLNLALANPTTVVDADLAPLLASADVAEFLDVAELRVIGTCLRNWAKVDQQAGIDRQSLGQLLAEWRQQYRDKLEEVKSLYGYGLQGLAAGVIDLGFEATDDPAALNQLFS